MRSHRWSNALPGLVQYYPRSVDEPGTLWHWQQAASKVTGEDEISDLVVDDTCDCRSENCESCFPPPAAEWSERADRAIELNRDSLRSFQDGVTANSLRLPVDPARGGADLSLIQGLRPLIRLAKIQANRLAEQGDMGGAAQTLAEIIDAGRLFLDSEGIIVDYLVGVAFVGVGTYGTEELLDRHRLPRRSLERLVDSISQLHFPRAAANTVRSELHRWTLPTLEQFEANFRLQGTAAYFESFSRDPSGLYAWREEQLRFLLGGYPAAFDAEEVAWQLAYWSAEGVSECEDCELDEEARRQIAQFSERLEQFRTVWPAELDHLIYDLSELPRSDFDRMFHEHMREENESLRPISDDRLQASREALRQMTNPLGLAVFNQMGGFRCSSLLHLPQIPYAEKLCRRIEALQKPTLASKLSELRRRWKRSRADRTRHRRSASKVASAAR